MIDESIPVDRLRVADLQRYPVWQYKNCDDAEIHVRPVRRWPVSKLTGKLIGTQVTLANGAAVWALIGNVDEANARLTQHFLTLSVEQEGRWFHLARYHDPNREECGPDALSAFLRLPLEDIFPIRYDIRPFARGKTEALMGYVRSEPLERLSREEIIGLAVP